MFSFYKFWHTQFAVLLCDNCWHKMYFVQKRNCESLEAVSQSCSLKKVFIKFLQNHWIIRRSFFLNRVAGPRPYSCNFIKKETLTQVFSCAFFESFKKTFFIGHLRGCVWTKNMHQMYAITFLFECFCQPWESLMHSLSSFVRNVFRTL